MKHKRTISTHWTLASILGATSWLLLAACSTDETQKPAFTPELSVPEAGTEPELPIEEEQEGSDAGTAPTPSAKDAASPTPAGLQTIPLQFDPRLSMRSTASYFVRITFGRWEDNNGYSRHEIIDIPVTASTTSLTIPLPPVPREENFSCERSATTSCDPTSPYRVSYGKFSLYEDKNANGVAEFGEQKGGTSTTVVIVYDDLGGSVLPTDEWRNVQGTLKKGFAVYERGPGYVWQTPATLLKFGPGAVLL